jgi:hypothetical protein
MIRPAEIFPPLRRLPQLALTRDQCILLVAAVNEIFLGIDTYLAHSISGTLRPGEWIPIIFGPIAGVILLIAGAIALRRRPLAATIATAILAASIAVGFLGAYFHLHRALLPSGPAGQRVTIDLLVWGPPILGPLTFVLTGLLGISAAWVERPDGSGALEVFGGRRLHMPYSKVRAYTFMVGLGTLATVVSSVLDHARTGFVNPWLWVPTVAGIFGAVVGIALAAIDRPRRADLLVYFATMLLLITVGVTGSALHVRDDLTSEGVVVVERFVKGAPFLAPLLFSNMGVLGLIVLLVPGEAPSNPGSDALGSGSLTPARRSIRAER